MAAEVKLPTLTSREHTLLLEALQTMALDIRATIVSGTDTSGAQVPAVSSERVRLREKEAELRNLVEKIR